MTEIPARCNANSSRSRASSLRLAALSAAIVLAVAGWGVSTPVAAADAAFTFTGSGWGHGVGMSQWGARGMAAQGSSAAQILGHAMATVRATINTPASPTADALNVNASMLLGGQIAGGKMGLYLIYGQGNFIECGPDTPYLQIGELKYGKPILDRALHSSTPLSEAVKLGLISFDSTIRSNIAVGPPLDLIVMPRDRISGTARRIEADDPYFRDLGRRWSEALAAAHRAMPDPTWLDAEETQPRPLTVVAS